MIDIQSLIETDKLATLSVNGSDSLFLDGISDLYTSIFVWIPLAVMAIYMIIKNVSARRLLAVLFLIVITVVLCDQLSSHVCKPLFMRLRPTRDPEILDMVDTVDGYHGGLYGFFSGHAANSFGLAVLFMWIVRDWWFGLSVGIWAMLNSLIRTYLGVHFLGDIIVGAIAGSLIASMVYWIYRMCVREKSFSQVHIDKYSRTYTSSGFLREDISLFLCFQFGTYLSIMIVACIVRGII